MVEFVLITHYKQTILVCSLIDEKETVMRQKIVLIAFLKSE